MNLVELQHHNDFALTYKELLDFLHSKGLSIDFILQDNSTVLHFLCSGKHLSLDTLLDVLENTSIDTSHRNEKGMDAFSLLLNNFSLPYLIRLKASKIFLEYGADPDAKSSINPSPRTLLKSYKTRSPWEMPLLSELKTRIKSVESDMAVLHNYEHEYRAAYDEEMGRSSLREVISERDYFSLQRFLGNEGELYNKADKSCIDIILKSRWGNLFEPDDHEILMLLLSKGFHVDENNLFEYMLQQKAFLPEILKMLREVKESIARTMSIWLLVSKDLSSSEKLVVIKELVDSSGGLDITEEIKSSVVYLEEESINTLIDVVFSAEAHVRWNEVMDEYIIATSEMFGVQIDELLSNNMKIIYDSGESTTKEEVKNALDNIRDKFTFRG